MKLKFSDSGLDADLNQILIETDDRKEMLIKRKLEEDEIDRMVSDIRRKADELNSETVKPRRRVKLQSPRIKYSILSDVIHEVLDGITQPMKASQIAVLISGYDFGDKNRVRAVSICLASNRRRFLRHSTGWINL